MKASKILLFAAVAALGMGFASCSKDYAKDVAATYDGTATVSMTMMGQEVSIGSVDAKLIVSAEDDDEVSITIPGYTYQQGMSLPSYTITDVDVTKSGKTYSLKNEKFEVKADGVTISGQFNGSVENSKLTADYSVQAEGMPHSMDFHFTTK